MSQFTPRETVSELERYIIGQNKAKRAVAIALRNRWRRQQLDAELREEVSPKNIIMIGPTGVGKTEIARRLAKLARAPFIKVEATKFTEVGYVGRDVEAMIRDLVERGIALVRDEQLQSVEVRASERAEERLVELLHRKDNPQTAPTTATQTSTGFGPFIVTPAPSQNVEKVDPATASSLRERLRRGELDDQEVELSVEDTSNPFMTVFGASGMEEINLKDMMNQLPGMRGKSKKRRVKVPEARELLKKEEAHKLLDNDSIARDAIERVEQAGIVFLDEIDKVAGRQQSLGSADVSREGVQRDLLPIVEGSTVNTKYGPVQTDHILFIAAGAFHVSKVTDLIPELQGRFPIRVELDSLEKNDFVRILREPRNSLTKQYVALMKTEGVELVFEDDAIDAIATYATEANERAENIGARRLHTIMEALLEELSFNASERAGATVRVSAQTVNEVLDPILGNEDLSRYVL